MNRLCCARIIIPRTPKDAVTERKKYGAYQIIRLSRLVKSYGKREADRGRGRRRRNE